VPPISFALSDWSYHELKGNEVEEEEVVYEEVPQPHVIETGDSLKVKQVLDDAVMTAVGNFVLKCKYYYSLFFLFP
jgi:hypothetical protein